MLLAHARAVAEARSYLGALADNAGTFDASLEYDRVLLQLDAIHGDTTPARHDVLPASRRVLHGAAATAIGALVTYGADVLEVELLLAALEHARHLDAP